jgi:hypothetical protein
VTPAARQDHIIRMMLAGQWKGARSRRSLAKEWSIHERTVGDDAVVASGVLSRRGKPIEELIDAKYAELEHIQKQAMEHKRAVSVSDGESGSHLEYVADPNFIAAIKAVQTQMELRGAGTKARTLDAGKPAADGVDGLLRSVLEDPALREKVTAMLAGKAKEMH